MKQAGLLTSVTILAVTGSVQAPVALAAAWREATQVDQVTGDDLPASQRSRLERDPVIHRVAGGDGFRGESMIIDRRGAGGVRSPDGVRHTTEINTKGWYAYENAHHCGPGLDAE
ncbi:MAG: hypothetical protein NTAFB01_04280 [Nitrospira sp.]